MNKLWKGFKSGIDYIRKKNFKPTEYKYPINSEHIKSVKIECDRPWNENQKWFRAQVSYELDGTRVTQELTADSLAELLQDIDEFTNNSQVATTLRGKIK